MNANTEVLVEAALQKGGTTFISNQHIPGILQACRESRNYCLAHTTATFAFETYIDFSKDIVYIQDFPYIEITFPRFYEYDEAKKLQKLALQKWLLASPPVRDERYQDAKIRTLREALPEWKETYVVFGDERDSDEGWYETERGLVEMSARQQRKKAEVRYARHTAKLWREVEEWFDIAPMTFHYMVFEEKIPIEKLQMLQI